MHQYMTTSACSPHTTIDNVAVHQLAPSRLSGSDEHLRDIKHIVCYLDVMDSDPGRVEFGVLFLKWVHILFFTFYM